MLPVCGAPRTQDYTNGQLPELIDIIIESGAKLFVCAVGVPPTWAVEKLHAANILVMNMIGAPKHVSKALASGVDIICAQGGEGGGQWRARLLSADHTTRLRDAIVAAARAPTSDRRPSEPQATRETCRRRC